MKLEHLQYIIFQYTNLSWILHQSYSVWSKMKQWTKINALFYLCNKLIFILYIVKWKLEYFLVLFINEHFLLQLSFSSENRMESELFLKLKSQLVPCTLAVHVLFGQSIHSLTSNKLIHNHRTDLVRDSQYYDNACYIILVQFLVFIRTIKSDKTWSSKTCSSEILVAWLDFRMTTDFLIEILTRTNHYCFHNLFNER